MIGYLAIDAPWSSFPDDKKEEQLASENWLHRVHGYPKPTAFKTVRNAFRAIQPPNVMALRHGIEPGGVAAKWEWGHLRVLDLSKLPALRFEDLSLSDRNAIIGERARAKMTSEELARAVLERTPNLTIPRRDTNANAIYLELQVAERQMTIWAERCDQLRREFEDVKHMTPVQKARRRHGKDRGFNAPELDPQLPPRVSVSEQQIEGDPNLHCSRCGSNAVSNGSCSTCGYF